MQTLDSYPRSTTVFAGVCSFGVILLITGALLGENPFSVFIAAATLLTLIGSLLYLVSTSTSRYLTAAGAVFTAIVAVLTLLIDAQGDLGSIEFFTFASLFPAEFRLSPRVSAGIVLVGSFICLTGVIANLVLRRQEQGEATILDRLDEALEAESVAGLANALFGDVVDRYREDFIDVKHHLAAADMPVLFRTYVAEMLLATIVAAVIGFVGVVVILFLVEMPVLFQIVLLLFFPILLAASTFTGLWLYPVKRARDRRYNIESNLPFALNQLAAIASSGLPPSQGFALLTSYRDYGEIAVEADKVVKRINVFGEDVTSAIRSVAENTPSDQFKEVLYGMLSVIETGGDMSDYLTVAADDALFEYKMERRQRIKSLSTYAAFYTALLVSAPLFMITILAVLNVLRGTIFGVQIVQAMRIGAYVIMPLLNTAFLIFLSIARVDV